jgi:hypothetical protein
MLYVIWHRAHTESADDYKLFHGNGNAIHHLGTGIFVHKRIISKVKREGFLIIRMIMEAVCSSERLADIQKPNVMVKWLTFQLRIREIPGSNLDPETSYSDCGFSWFSSVTPANDQTAP